MSSSSASVRPRRGDRAGSGRRSLPKVAGIRERRPLEGAGERRSSVLLVNAPAALQCEAADELALELAILLAAVPGALAKMFAEHQDDGTGHCRRCPLGQRGYQVSPCNISVVAERALRLQERGGAR